ncbi:TonB-dependent receptor [Croceibacterium sp. TMG7-5b_MA50]|uniref:TonB-dependent receptor domain-containing protein n=1 Tax=Croceibacterium sp. TMG7-5b_MA50 TaxID=3121290 RepID=UPI003221F43C
MTTAKQLAGLLLLTTGLSAPFGACAQGTTASTNAGVPAGVPNQQPAVQDATADQIDPATGEPVPTEADISVPGGEIIVTGRINRDLQRNATQVLSILSAEQIARTGEGDIAGALGRVTGLSVQGNGFVFVRGLGDRYSLALLNGLPLPSPEPLSRVVPLDIFPTNVVASSLVQKTYSANYPGEFGGGVINLTTSAVPDESFVTVGGGISGDTETTGQVGYSYFGSDSDWTGFDDGSRDTPPALQAFFDSGQQLSDVTDRGTVRDIIKDITNPQFMTLQRLNRLPVNFSGAITAGTGIDVGEGRLGIIATAGINNRWRNRLIQSDASGSADLQLNSSFLNYTTDNRVLVNGLLGLGFEIGEHRFRWTNLYIRDTLKQSVLGIGTNFDSGNAEVDQNTSWFERQLIDTQFVGEMEFGDLGVDLRAGYAQTQREAPFEYSLDYFQSPGESNPFPGLWQNTLDGQRSDARVVFSDLTEDNYSAGLDLSYPVLDWLTTTVGYAYTKTDRISSRREFRIRANGAFPAAFSLLQPAGLLSDDVIDFGESDANTDPSSRYQLLLDETTSATPTFLADLEVHGAYIQARAEPVAGLTIDAGVRYEDAVQTVAPDLSVYTNPLPDSGATTSLGNDYFLPAATLTYEVTDGLQARLSASRTIARPQFRELIFQAYQDPESTRVFQGNPLLTDSELLNLEARAEYYPAGGVRALVAGFYKNIDRPIEAFATYADGRVLTSFANAPSAELYGAEAEFEYRYDLADIGDFFSTKELLVVANYTYTQSSISVQEGDRTAVFGYGTDDATLFFRPDAPLTGQSDHLVNLQLGLEDSEQLQQLTFLFSYASDRVVSRGFNQLPDILETPGTRLDVVFRQGLELGGTNAELKLEARNIFGTDHQEFQDNGTNRIEINSWDIGTTFGASLSVTF